MSITSDLQTVLLGLAFVAIGPTQGSGHESPKITCAVANGAATLDSIRFPVPDEIRQVDGHFNDCAVTYYARCHPKFLPCEPGKAEALAARLVAFYAKQRIGELKLGPLTLGFDGYGLRWKATATQGQTTVQLNLTVDGKLVANRPQYAASATGVNVEMKYVRPGSSRPYGKPAPPPAERCTQPAPDSR